MTRVALLAEGLFARATAKTAIGVLRYAPYEVVAVIDSTQVGADAGDIVGVGHGVPVVADVEQAVARGADVLLVGTASAGGRIPDVYRPFLDAALSRGITVWNGLHERVLHDASLASAAARGGAAVWELRDPPADLAVGGHRVRRVSARVVLTVGSDAAVGKMTVSLELQRALERAGHRTAFVATGQTGIAIAGSGISVDAVIGDFIAGASEQLVCEAAEDADWVIVEGQGSLTHPGFSAVTLGLLHGSAPDLLVLCHDAARTHVRGHPELPLRPLPELVHMYEAAALWSRPGDASPVPVVAIGMNTVALDDADAARAVAEAAHATGLPAADPVREGDAGADRLAAALIAASAA